MDALELPLCGACGAYWHCEHRGRLEDPALTATGTFAEYRGAVGAERERTRRYWHGWAPLDEERVLYSATDGTTLAQRPTTVTPPPATRNGLWPYEYGQSMLAAPFLPGLDRADWLRSLVHPVNPADPGVALRAVYDHIGTLIRQTLAPPRQSPTRWGGARLTHIVVDDIYALPPTDFLHPDLPQNK